VNRKWWTLAGACSGLFLLMPIAARASHSTIATTADSTSEADCRRFETI
jgi:hypothetical protein